MNKVFKGGNTLWIIVSIICLLCALGLLFFMLHERTQRIKTEQKLSETEKAKRDVEIKLSQAQLELIGLKDQAKLLAKQVEEEKKNYHAVLAEVDKRDVQIKELENNLANEKNKSARLSHGLEELRSSYGSFEERLKEAKLKAEELRRLLAQFTGKAGVALKKIVIRPKQKLSGKVLVVNREFRFVVIDLGKKDGVSVGDQFVIYHGSQEIGKVEVEKVYDAMSTASILSGSQEQMIKEDAIIRSF